MPFCAIAPLERAFRIREAKETDPARRADTSFALARALWEANREHERARALAASARDAYARASMPSKRADVDAWLDRTAGSKPIGSKI